LRATGKGGVEFREMEVAIRRAYLQPHDRDAMFVIGAKTKTNPKPVYSNISFSLVTLNHLLQVIVEID
jgi:hypothetical protein